jgi:hypothetical protein
LVTAILWFAIVRGYAEKEARKGRGLYTLELIRYPVIDLVYTLLAGPSTVTEETDESTDEFNAILPE